MGCGGCGARFNVLVYGMFGDHAEALASLKAMKVTEARGAQWRVLEFRHFVSREIGVKRFGGYKFLKTPLNAPFATLPKRFSLPT